MPSPTPPLGVSPKGGIKDAGPRATAHPCPHSQATVPFDAAARNEKKSARTRRRSSVHPRVMGMMPSPTLPAHAPAWTSNGGRVGARSARQPRCLASGCPTAEGAPPLSRRRVPPVATEVAHVSPGVAAKPHAWRPRWACRQTGWGLSVDADAIPSLCPSVAGTQAGVLGARSPLVVAWLFPRGSVLVTTR